MNILFWIVGIVLLIVAMIFFLVLQDKEKELKQKISKYLKNESVVEVKKSSIDLSFFQQGLRGVEFVHDDIKKLKQELHKKIVGLDVLLNAIILNLFCEGHILVEGVPGLAKTKVIRSLAEVMSMEFKRIQFTPDLLPSDILGVEIYNSQTKEFEAKMGPIVANIVLADEINRATPKVQSALLEAMQEQQVTIGGNTIKLPQPFFVLATQNPLEHEGTYPLPEAQIDRFLFKINLDYPNLQEEIQVLNTVENEKNIKLKAVMTAKKLSTLKKGLEKIVLSEEVKSYIGKLVHATRQKDSRLEYGASPRGSLGLALVARVLAYLEGRDFVKIQDVQRVFLAVMRHRVVLSYEAKIDGLNVDEVLLDLVGHGKIKVIENGFLI